MPFPKAESCAWWAQGFWSMCFLPWWWTCFAILSSLREVFSPLPSIPQLPVDARLVEASHSEKTGLSFAAFKGNLPPSCPRGLAAPGQTWGSAFRLCQGLCGLFPNYPNAGMKVCGPLPLRHCCTTVAAVGMGRCR